MFALAAGYHVLGIIYEVDDKPVWKHLIFVVIDLFFVYGLHKRTKYFIYIFAIFLLQQYFSHGNYLLLLWQEKHKVHWISLFILIILPIVLICLYEEQGEKKN
jgi:hypothetical protein